MRQALCIASTMLMLIGAVTLPAQQQERPARISETAFEVASIRRNVSGSTQERWPNLNPAGQLEVINLRVSDLVQAAYQVGDHQVLEMPAWARNTRYDISARLDPGVAAALQPTDRASAWGLALRTLLEERLQLAFHRETQQRPVYDLMLARPDGKLGPNMRPAAFNCDALREQAAAAARAGAPSPYPEPTDTRIACGIRPSAGRILQGGSELGPELMAVLGRAAGRPVFNRTGVTGKWDFLLTFTPDAALLRATEPPPTDAPDLFTALREQLGLKLESATGPIPMFVIDRIEPPSEN